jgi:hypothetical protein
MFLLPVSKMSEKYRIYQLDPSQRISNKRSLDGVMRKDWYNRHDHNWGIVSIDNQIELIPSFDHGLSLGSTDEDEDKLKLSLSDYVDLYSQSCFQAGYSKCPNLTIFDRAAQLYPDAARIWQERLAQITTAQINGIFDRIPESVITPVAAKFAIDLLAYNQKRIANLEIESIPKNIQ